MPSGLSKNLVINSSLIFLSIIAVAVYVISPLVIKEKQANWKAEIENKIDDIETSINASLQKKVDELLEAEKSLAEILDSKGSDGDTQIELFNSLKNPPFSGYSIQILDSLNELVAWNNATAYDKADIYNRDFQAGEIYFRNYELYSFLTINNLKGPYKFSISLPVTKHFTLENEYFSPLDLKSEFETRFSTSFNIQYDRTAQLSKDGRNYSFAILNNFGNKIGVIDFVRPARDYELNKLQLKFDFILALSIILFLIVVFYKYFYLFRKIKSHTIRVFVFTFLVVFIRVVMFALNVPGLFLENELLNASYFSSIFAYGIVRSPLEFFITVSAALIICVFIARSISAFSERINILAGKNTLLRIFYALLLLVLVLFLLRGYGASIKSVVFDSTLRYFRDPSLLPELPALLMHLNVLILGFCSILIGSVFLLIILRLLGFHKDKFSRYGFLAVFIIIQILAWVFDYIQKDPQGTEFTRIAFITLVTIFGIILLRRSLKGVKPLLVFSLSASFMTIILLSFYNSELERESLKVTALELIRPNENYLEYAVFQTLNQSINIKVVQTALTTDNNSVQAAFKIWSNSLLQKEAIRSKVSILDKDFFEIGSYNFQYPDDITLEKNNYQSSDAVEITHHDLSDSENHIITGRAAVWNENNRIGYVEVSVIYNKNRLQFDEVPPFLQSSLSSFNKTVDQEKLRIFDFQNKKLINSVSDFELPVDITESILRDDFNSYNDKWLYSKINEEDYVIYALRNKQEDYVRIISVLLKERDITWNLFDFFKVFFIHTIFILFAVLIYSLWYNKITGNLKVTYRSQLLFYFLIVSIIPSILLAVYFKDLTEEKNNSAIYYKLNKRVESIDTYLSAHLYNNIDDALKVLQSASRDLGISYTLFMDDVYVFSSEDIYYNIGLMEKNIDPTVYSLFKYRGMRDLMIQRKIENYTYNSYFKLIKIRDHDYIIEVSDLFNKILLPLSDIELDVILFGTYSLVAILVAFFSTLLASQISRPIRRLTNATQSIASGDLSIKIEGNWKGEIKELTDGFNKMVKDLKKSQAQIADMERESAWKEMAKQVAHEIKNPLTPMKLSVQQLIIAYKDKSPKFNDIFEKVTDTVIGQIDILKNIASEFSNFARMPSLKLSEINPKNVVNQIYNLFSDEKVEMKLSHTNKDYFINVDEDELKRTLVNLVRNSMQAGAKKIEINLNGDDQFCYIRVIDDGKGIEEAIVHKIFDKDFTTKESGMGLGLSMAKRFLSSIKSDIKVDSTSGSGTTILITIPLIRK